VTEQGTQVLAAVFLAVIGLSHLLQPKVWVAYYQGLAAKGPRGAFVEGFHSLMFGGIILGFHNVWHGPAVVLTVIGCGQVAKGLTRFLAPRFSLRVMSRMEDARSFRFGGVFALVLSGYLWWLRFRA
jgi:hypothetical protein